ncbi:unnamed protein product [marine sediment metagenome]|uniref:Uncharacterized protein n=1 Tax=marine sediment metagenome TaxID=412755 RepID=X0YKU2_9ZZZZ
MEEKESMPLVVAEHTHHQGALFGHISNGDGIITLGNNKALRFVIIAPTHSKAKFVKIQLLEYGIGKDIATQSWQKSKVVKAPGPKPKLKKKIEQVKLVDKVETGDLL